MDRCILVYWKIYIISLNSTIFILTSNISLFGVNLFILCFKIEI
jgi:hypothetical protein